MSKLHIPSVIEKCIALAHEGRQVMSLFAETLYEVAEQELWREKADSFSEFCEEHLKISQSQSSKILSVYKRFCIEGNFAPNVLSSVSLENAYLSLRLEGSPKEQLEKARTLRRQELSAQKIYEQSGEECLHPNKINLCADCRQRLS